MLLGDVEQPGEADGAGRAGAPQLTWVFDGLEKGVTHTLKASWRAFREGALVGSILVVFALVAWLGVLAGTVPDSDDLQDARSTPGRTKWADGGVSFDFDYCSHCPLYVVAGRGLLHGYEMPPTRFWLLVNWPALAMSAVPPGRHGTAEVPMGRFIVSVAAQWFTVGLLARFSLGFIHRMRAGS